MLHTHRNIACASDPYRPFFNSLRDSIAEEIDVETPPYAPLGSYYADEEQRRLFETIQSTSLDREFDRNRETLLSRVRSHGRQFSPRIIEDLTEVPGETFGDVYRNLLTKVPAQYGDGDEQWQATKEVWTTEFVPALAKAFPESRFLLVVRDPRAVAASNNVEETTKYPWMFLARQWRKLAILSWAYDRNPEFGDRVEVVRYEDLVQSPRETATDMCEFLDIDLDERILDPSNFVDGHGDQWLQNTSYDDGGASFNTDSVDKWQNVLTDRETALIEQCCLPSMDQFGYDLSASSGLGIEDELLLAPPVVESAEMADWISNYYPNRTQHSLREELGSEGIRQRLLLCDDAVLTQLDDATVRSYMLSEAFCIAARSSLRP
jgi:hypothetical protein